MTRLIILFLFILAVKVGYCQLLYPIEGRFNKKSAQGMAVYGDIAFLMNDGGGCRMVNLRDGKMIKNFNLASYKQNPHVNNACFGIEKSEDSNFPFIYITECRKDEFRCFVETIGNNPRVVQTIQAKRDDKILSVLVWVVDRDQKVLYAVTRNSKLLDSLGNVCNTFIKYRLPKINEGSYVVLTEKDVIDSFEIVFPNVLQGCKIKGRYMYQVTGLQQTHTNIKGKGRAIKKIDLKNKRLVKDIDITYLTTNEPEDIDFHKGKCLLFCGQEGGIYRLKLK